MDFQEALLREHSKDITRSIARYIGGDDQRFAQFLDLFLSAEPVIVQRAAWVLSEVGIAHPALFQTFQDRLVAALQQPHHPAVRRNILKVFADAKLRLSEEAEGIVVNLCFDLIANPQEAAAIRVHAMQFVANLLHEYPDLAVELKELLEDGLEHGSAGFCNRARKILQKINRLERDH